MKRDKYGLTEREREIYNYIVQFKKTNGFSPSWNEIKDGCCVAKLTVQKTLYKLHDLGYIRYNEKKQRAIVVLVFLPQEETKQLQYS